MYKKIPGTLEYRINLNKEIVNLSGEPQKLKETSGKIEIELFGKLKRVTLQWLALLAHYECGEIVDLGQHLDKIRFTPAAKELRTRCGFIMVFAEPVYYKEGFRYTPCFPRYAIDIDGNIIDTLRNEFIVDRYHQNGYDHVYLRTPDKGTNKHVRLHRLLGLAWLPNTDFVNKPIINHIDGVKSSNALKNLEWCSYSENNTHAVEIGLNNQLIAMKSRDVFTGEVVVYSSSAELSRKLGLSIGYSAKSYSDRLPGFLHKKRYEVKRNDDLSPWYYESNSYDPKRPLKQHVEINVLDKSTGEVSVFTNVREFYKAYKVYDGKNIDDSIAKFKDRFPILDISYRKNITAGPYRVVNVKTNKITIISSIREAARSIDRGYNEISLDLKRGLKYIYAGEWIVVPGLDEFDVSEYQEKPKPYLKIQIINEKDGSVTIANSIKDASRITGVMPRTIDLKIKNGEAIKCLRFRPLE